jgi:hypothetical protein
MRKAALSIQHSALSIQHGFNAPDQSFAAAIPLRTGITNLRISPQTVSSEISATWFFLQKATHCFLLSTSSKKSSYEHNAGNSVFRAAKVFLLASESIVGRTKIHGSECTDRKNLSFGYSPYLS